jgi:hypothetical protein
MTTFFRILGKYNEDNAESIIAETVNGDRIHTRAQAHGIIGQWQERIRCNEMFPVRDWRIETYEA